jgi:hypothetical protein
MKRFLLILVLLMSTRAFGAGPSRRLCGFDFEERALGNDEDQPMHWTRQAGDGFPHYVTGRLTTDKARSGKYSFRMDLNGGSCVYYYDPTRIPVATGAHYHVEVFCQTTTLQHARARISAYLVDTDFKPVPGSEKHSAPFCSEGVEDTWTPLSVDITADTDKREFLVLKLELLQPEKLGDVMPGRATTFDQDIHGTAWFDDLTVEQVPLLTLSSDHPGNVFGKSDQPVLTALLNDRTTDDLTTRLIVTDMQGRQIYQQTAGMESAEHVSDLVRKLTLPLPMTPPGWYRASLLMTTDGQIIGRQTLDFVRLGDDGYKTQPDGRFGFDAIDIPFDAWPDLTRVLPTLSAGRVKLAVWSTSDDVGLHYGNKLDEVLETFQNEGILPTGCLIALPPQVARKARGDAWSQLASSPRDAWQPALAQLISRHAHRIDQWQMGSNDSAGYPIEPEMRSVYASVLGEFTRLIDHPDLAMPCPIDYEVPPPQPTSLVLSVPTTVLPSEIPLYLADLHGRSMQSTTLSLSLLDPGSYDRSVRIADLTQRIVYSLSAGATHLDLPLPLVNRQQGETASLQPTDLLPPIRTLLTALANTTCRGRLPVADGVTAFLFERNGRGTVVLWSDHDPAEQTLAVDVTDDSAIQTLDGTLTAVRRAAGPAVKPDEMVLDDGGVHRAGGNGPAADGTIKLVVGRSPILITNVDADLGRFRAGVNFDQPLIESNFQPHARHIRLTNIFNQPITGTLKLHAPKGWTIAPSSMAFTLNPGETFDRTVSLDIPFNSVSGPYPVTADVIVQTTKRSVLSVPLTLTLGLTDVGTQTMAFRDGTDVVVQQMITNYGDAPISYVAFASFPGRPRIERVVATLVPGKTALKRYRFLNVPAGQPVKIRVGFKEMDGPRLLNDEAEIK